MRSGVFFDAGCMVFLFFFSFFFFLFFWRRKNHSGGEWLPRRRTETGTSLATRESISVLAMTAMGKWGKEDWLTARIAKTEKKDRKNRTREEQEEVKKETKITDSHSPHPHTQENKAQ